MRRVSKKRAALIKAVAKWRKDFRIQIGRCELCLKPAHWGHLDCDEIARGSFRGMALTARFAILSVHRHCHSFIQNWSRPKRLALLYLSRPEDYDLEKFWELTRRRFPEHEDVLVAAEEIKVMRCIG